MKDHEIKGKINEEITKTEKLISDYKDMSKPVSLDNYWIIGMSVVSGVVMNIVGWVGRDNILFTFVS